jgi:AraC-like DNA-binding protein
LPIKRIADRLGFAGEKSFSRAFARWTGQSPAAWRRGARNLSAKVEGGPASQQPAPRTVNP